MLAQTNATTFVDSFKVEVEVLLHQVAATAILPRFRRLCADDIIEKAPGELVTVADRHAEAMLEETLGSVLPGSRVVGEEGCSANASVLEHLDEGLVWIVDPLDGTAHFAAGREPFGTMVALAVDGAVIAGWIYNPVRDLMFTAVLGGGAFLRDAGGAKRPLKAGGPVGRPIAGLATQFMTPELRAQTVERAKREFDLQPIPRCAAEHYPRLCRGENHIALFQRTLPWDHAAGALLLTEAGGHVARWDGTPYRFHDDGLGILAATTPGLWQKAADTLFSAGLLHSCGRRLLPPVADD